MWHLVPKPTTAIPRQPGTGQTDVRIYGTENCRGLTYGQRKAMSAQLDTLPTEIGLQRLGRSRLLGVAMLLWAALAVSVGVKAVIEPVAHTAYPCFETGARLWWQGKDVYDPAVCPHDFRYGPVFAVALAPLALLPSTLGGLLWGWLNIGAFFWSLRALLRQVLPGHWTPRREAIYLVLVLAGSVRMIWSGQSNPLIFALVAGAAVSLLNRRWWWAGLLLAIAVHIKVWPLAAALLLTACRPRQLGWRFAVSLAVVGTMPFLTGPPAWVCRQYYGWYLALIGPAQIRHIYRDAWTIWELIHSPVSPQGYLALQLTMAAVVLTLCLWQRRRAATDGRLLTFVLAIWAAWQLLFGPGTERNTFGLIAPLSAWAVLTCLEEKRGRVVMGAAFVLITASSFGMVERGLMDFFPAILAAHPLGVLLFATWLLGWTRISSGLARQTRHTADVAVCRMERVE